MAKGKQVKVGGLLINLGVQYKNVKEGLDATSRLIKKASGEFAKLSTVSIGINTASIIALEKTIMSLANKGEVASSIADGFRALGGSSTELDKASASIQGLVGKYELMQIANSGLLKQIPGYAENFSLIADYGARMADVLGQEAAPGIQQVTDALAGAKEKQLAAIGITIDSEKAYKDYAAAHNLAADTLTDLQQKEARQISALQNMIKELEKLPAVGGSASDAQTEFNNKLDDTYKNIGVVINGNEELAGAWQEMSGAMDEVDWETVGRNLAEIGVTLLNLGKEILPVVVQGINDFSRGLNYLLGTNTQAQADRLATKIAEVEEGISKRKAYIADLQANYNVDSPYISSDIRQSQREIDAMGKSIQPAKEEFVKLAQQLDVIKNKGNENVAVDEKRRDVVKKLTDAAAHAGDVSGAALKKQQTEAAKAAKELEALQTKWSDVARDFKQEQLEFNLNSIVSSDNIDLSAFDSTLNELRKAVGEAVELGWADAQKSGMSREWFDQYKNFQVSQKSDSWLEKQADQAKQAAEKLEEAEKEAHKNATEFWRTSFENAITGVSFDLEDMLKQVLVGFVSEFMASLSGSLEGVKSPQDLGGSLASGLGDLFKSDIGSSFKDAIKGIFADTSVGTTTGLTLDGGGLSSSVGGIEQAFGDLNGMLEGLGVSGEEASAGMSQLGGAISALGIQVGTSQLISMYDDGKQEPLKGAAWGAVSGGSVGYMVGGPVGAGIGAAVGALAGTVSELISNKDHPDTAARKQTEEKIDELITAIKGVKYFDDSGKIQNYDDFTPGEGGNAFKPYQQFNNESGQWEWTSWGDKFNSLETTARESFYGIGYAMQALAGTTRDVGAQIGYVFSEQLAGDADNARLMMEQLGLSMQDVHDALLQQATEGTISWQQFNESIAGVSMAFEDGLTAVGDYEKAFNMLVESGGRGIAASRSIRDMGVEALEAGITTFEGLQQALIAAGNDPEVVNALITAIKQKGVATIQELSQLSSEVAGSIAGDLAVLSPTLGNKWEEIGNNVDTLNKKLNDLPENVESSVNVNMNVDDRFYDVAQTLKDLGSGSIDININAGTGGVTPHATGGIVSSPTFFTSGGSLHLAGEAGLEGILPLTKVNGKLGVSALGAGSTGKQVVINVDARGATPGVEQYITLALRDVEERLSRRILNIAGA